MMNPSQNPQYGYRNLVTGRCEEIDFLEFSRFYFWSQMLADAPAIAYRASWNDLLSAEFAANFKIDFGEGSDRKL
jgi:hypothetical protein